MKLSLPIPWSHIGVPVELHSFLTSALDRGKQSTSCPGLFTPRQEPQHPLNRRLGGQSGHFGNKKNLFPLLGYEPHIIQPVTQALCRLCYPGSGTVLKHHWTPTHPTNTVCDHYTWWYKYRVIHKSLRNFRTRLRNNQDTHGRKEHINR